MRRRQKTWTEYPLRTCRTPHECALCYLDIKRGETYHDGGGRVQGA